MSLQLQRAKHSEGFIFMIEYDIIIEYNISDTLKLKTFLQLLLCADFYLVFVRGEVAGCLLVA